MSSTLRVRRWSKLSAGFTGSFSAFVVALIFVPVLLSENATAKMTTLLILVLLAAMWNASRATAVWSRSGSRASSASAPTARSGSATTG